MDSPSLINSLFFAKAGETNVYALVAPVVVLLIALEIGGCVLPTTPAHCFSKGHHEFWHAAVQPNHQCAARCGRCGSVGLALEQLPLNGHHQDPWVVLFFKH